MKTLRTISVLALVPAAVGLGAQGCSADPVPAAAIIPAPGQLMVALSTDLVPGKDFDELRLVVVYDGRKNDRTSLTWTVTEGVVRGSVPLPATVALVGRADAGGPVTIRAQAYLDGVPRVLREARVEVPARGAKLLRLEVSALCYDHVVRARRDDPQSDCDPGSACVLGSCATSTVDARTLEDYAPELVFGTKDPAARDATCFDVLGEMGGGFDATPRLEGGRCVLRSVDLARPAPLPDGGALSPDAGLLDAGAPDASADAGVADATTASGDAGPDPAIAFTGNLALRLAPNSQGFCTSDTCLVPLLADRERGWSLEGNRLVLPRAVCDSPSPRVVVQPRGPSTKIGTYACGEWHASSKGARSVSVSSPIATNGSPCLDARSLCTEHHTSCGSLWVRDSSCAEARVVHCGECRGDTDGMVLVPGGSFLLGSPASDADSADDERPQIPVTLPSFWLDRAEVTAADYAECIHAGICTRGNTGALCNMQANDLPQPGRERHPINCVSWYQASTYCAWRGRRLPTEAEWEYEARGGRGGTRKYPWGDAFPTLGHVCRSDKEPGDRETTCEGGTHPLGDSIHGVVDLSGNVWEWTSSVYADEGHGRLGDPEERTEKGGSWASYGTAAERGELQHLRAGFRSYDARGYQSRTVGFRCARDF